MGKGILFVLIPLILTIGIVPALPISNADYMDNIYREDDKTQCREGQVLVFRTTGNDYICTNQGTALRWASLGIAEIVGKPIEIVEEVEEVIEEPSDEIDEKSIIPVVSGGTEPITATPIIGTPTKNYPENYVPGTEELNEDEIRLTFLGTGMPFPTRNQAAAGVLMEFGNGDILMFDVGSGTVANFNSMKISPADLTKMLI